MSKKQNNPLGVTVENTDLEWKILELDKQKEKLFNNFKAHLLQIVEEISILYGNTSNEQLRRLSNGLNIHKTILLMTPKNVKKIYVEACISNLKKKLEDELINSIKGHLQEESISNKPSELLQKVTDFFFDRYYDLPPVCEEDEEYQNELLAEHEQLQRELEKLEHERDRLLEEI
ncbi:hypothetical protein ABEB36_001983 [Hypothenemus hampei]|uniref:Uncharacterized protein n=1 Tax=Hypothenemus hampei TaxID=57062 RepID=A0ABD1FGC8_HYPHA